VGVATYFRERGKNQLAFLTMTNIRHFWMAPNFHYPMQTIKTM
jgi:hypothetical protein